MSAGYTHPSEVSRFQGNKTIIVDLRPSTSGRKSMTKELRSEARFCFLDALLAFLLTACLIKPALRKVGTVETSCFLLKPAVFSIAH